MISARDHVAHLAELDAMAFVEMFDRPFEDTAPDQNWLRDAWRAAIEDASLNEEEAGELAAYYRREVERESRRLATSAGGKGSL